MRRRADEIAARLNWQSVRRSGTSVILDLPLKAAGTGGERGERV